MRALIAAACLLALAAPVQAQTGPVTPADMMRHIEVLASDAFEGRKPATQGETRTLEYIVAQLQARGIEAGGEEGSWYQQVRLVERKPVSHRATWSTGNSPVRFDNDDLILIGREASERVAGAPVIFVGHGLVDPARNVDQLAGVNLQGAVALILYEGPDVPNFPSYADRVKAVVEAGAAAVIGMVGPDIPWRAVKASFASGQTGLDAGVPHLTGAMTAGAAVRLFDAAGSDLEALLNAQSGPSFRAVAMPLRATLEATTSVNRYVSYNVIGRLRGSGQTGESLLYLGHWDHIGLCAPESTSDRICNGAVDNASGIAMMIEIAGRLASGPRPRRDVLFLATTAEEIGLLGAEHFATHPTVPLTSIVAALNLDTVAINRGGQRVAVTGRGVAPLDALIEQTVAELGREMEPGRAADAFLERQDGWALTRAGVPAVMVGGSFANPDTLGAFLSGPYHAPDDDLLRDIPLEGAAEDADLMIALGRKLADPAIYQRPQGRLSNIR